MSMTFLMIALLRPASAQFCSSYAIAIAAGTLMAMYALFQMLASVLVVIIQRSEKEFGGECQARAEVGSAIFLFCGLSVQTSRW